MKEGYLLQLADAVPKYQVSSLYDSCGNVAAHFLDEIVEHGHEFEQLMGDPIFAQIIDKELEGESIANAVLSPLAEKAPNERIKVLFLKWLGFINGYLQPWTTGGAIHFRPHWARVLMLSLVLGESLGLPDVDLEALAMAAVFHDSRRRNPYMDVGHGDRAANYYKTLCLQADSEGVACLLDKGDIRFDPRTYLVVKWHDRDDDLGLDAMKHALCDLPLGSQADSKTMYLIFKDADGLDRVRLGQGEPDVRYLRTQAAYDLLPFAHELLDASLKIRQHQVL